MSALRLLPLACLALTLSTALAELVTFEPIKDNTLFENSLGNTSNGAGNYLFVGATADYGVRRGLIQFDLTSLPTDIVIESVTLRLFVSKEPPLARPAEISMHRLNASWGEGASDAGEPGGNGIAAEAGDATWLFRAFPGTPWATPGGDFVGTASAIATVSGVNSFFEWTGAGLIADVEAWRRGGAVNHGWLLLGDEQESRSAKRFNAREAGIGDSLPLATRPQLSIEFSTIPEPGAAVLLLAGLSAGLWRLRRRAAVPGGVAAVAMLAAGAMAQGPIAAPIQQGPAFAVLQPVATGLVAPLLTLTAPGDTGRQFIVDQVGQIRVLQGGVLSPTPFLNVSSRLSNLNVNYDERGLLGVAFDPGFANPASPGYRRVFTYTSEPTASGTADFAPANITTVNHHSVIASWRVDIANPNVIDPTTRQEVLRFAQPQSNHNGGALAFGPDGFLYIGSGDGGGANDNNANGHNPTIGNGQDTQTLLGKMLRIDVNGSNSANGKYGIPATNPYAAGGGLREIYATGFRNPYSFSFDGDDLLVADVGQNNIEELSRVTLGGNYGWRYKEGSFRFDPATGGVSADLTGVPTGLIDPILQYDHDEGISIIGGFVYRGSLLSGLQGKYIFADFSLTTLAAPTPEGRLFYGDLSTGEIREFANLGAFNPRDYYIKGMGQDAAGELYVTASTRLGPGGTTGVVFQIVPEPAASLLGAVGLLGVVARSRRRG